MSKSESPNRKTNEFLNTPRKIYITRKTHFNAAHQLFNPAWTDDKNKAIFGPCSNIHGHNYNLEVTLFGTVDKTTGFLFDLKKLTEIIDENILQKVDHHHLNLDVDIFRNTIPTAEVMAIVFWNILEEKINSLGLPHVHLYKIKLYETERNSVTYRGD